MTSADDTIGVGVIGLGIGQEHARAYAAIPECKLVVLCDRDENRARSIAAELGAPAITTDYRELLADARVQIVSIASHDADHYEQALAALRAGKHVFVEKPACRTAEELTQLCSAWRERGGQLKLTSNLVLRTAALYRWLRERVQDGTFGEIYAFDGEYLYGRIHKITEGWRRNEPDYSVVLGGAIHLIDLMLWISGERPMTATADGNRITTRETDFRYNDYVAATLRFPSGMLGRITANFGCVHPHQHVVRVFGTKATLIYDDAGPRLFRSRDEKPAERLALEPLPTSKTDLIADFVAAVCEDRDYSAETRLVFDGIAACIACDEAVSSGSTTSIRCYESN